MQVSDEKKQKALRYSLWDGAFYSIMIGFGESFFAPFAVLLKASDWQLGILGTIPQTIGSICQLLSVKVLELFHSRKIMTVMGAILQGLLYLPMILCLDMSEYSVEVFLLMVACYTVAGSMIGPVWNSWMGDLLNEDERARYFAKRNRINGLTTLIGFYTAGLILNYFSESYADKHGFMLLFFAACLMRLISAGCLMRKCEPPQQGEESAYLSPTVFLNRIRGSNYLTFLKWQILMNFAVFLSAPFFSAYMLKSLNLSYSTYTLVCTIPILTKMLAMPLLGRMIDRFGGRRMLSIGGLLMPFSSVLWIFSGDVWWLCLAQVYAGLVWGCVELSVFSFVYDATKSRNRTAYVAYSTVLGGMATLLGSATGASVLHYFSWLSCPYHLIFLLSTVLRLTVSLIYLPQIREERKVRSIRTEDLLIKMIGSMTNRGLTYSLITMKRRWHRRK